MALTRAKEAAREGAHLLLCGEPGSGKRTLARWVHRLCGGLPDTFLVADDPEDRVAIRRRIRPLRKWAERPGSSRQPAPYAVSHTLYVAGLERLSARRMEPWVKALHDMFEEEPGGAVRIATAICCDPTRCADLGERIAPLTAYFGGSVMRIDVPPLRERMEDIPLLVEHFRRGRAGGGGFHGPVFSEEAMDALRRYAWPGNVRELELLVARARMAGSGDPVTTEDVSRWLESPDERAGVLPLREAVRAFEHRQIESALRRTGDNKVEAARMLGIGLSSLYRKLDEWKRDHAGFS
ncbi:MAG: hypothetical protein D6788_11725 [Planctomycetota bacterium]|nr:MAG: hypothetical protein D6788_11725 [Planctomycetota bacterium]